MTKKLITRSGKYATPTFEQVLSKLESGKVESRTYRDKVINDYVLGLGSSLTDFNDLKLAFEANRFLRSTYFDFLKHKGPLLDIFSAYRNCTFFPDAAYYVKPSLFEEAWDNVSCIYGSMTISRYEAHFFKNILNVLGIKSTFNRIQGSNKYFTKIYCGSVAILNLKLFSIRRFIGNIASLKCEVPFIREPSFRYRFLSDPFRYTVITGDRIWYRGHFIKKWSIQCVNGIECLKTACFTKPLSDWRVYLTI